MLQTHFGGICRQRHFNQTKNFFHIDKGGKQMHFLSAMDGQSAPDFAVPKKFFID